MKSSAQLSGPESQWDHGGDPHTKGWYDGMGDGLLLAAAGMHGGFRFTFIL